MTYMKGTFSMLDLTLSTCGPKDYQRNLRNQTVTI